MAFNSKKYDISEELHELCQALDNEKEVIPASERKNYDLSRPTATKAFWAYVKQEELQDPDNKRVIICDKLLTRMTNKKQMTMFEVAKVLNDHLFDS